MACLGGLLAVISLFPHLARAQDSADLAKKSLNPVADLISFPMKLDWDDSLGATNADRSLWVVQPVIPISINDKWNVISRTVTMDLIFRAGQLDV